MTVRAEIVKINCDNPEISLVRYAADRIRAGEVLGMPTDTFYGLVADPFNCVLKQNPTWRAVQHERVSRGARCPFVGALSL